MIFLPSTTISYFVGLEKQIAEPRLLPRPFLEAREAPFMPMSFKDLTKISEIKLQEGIIPFGKQFYAMCGAEQVGDISKRTFNMFFTEQHMPYCPPIVPPNKKGLAKKIS